MEATKPKKNPVKLLEEKPTPKKDQNPSLEEVQAMILDKINQME